MKNRLMPLEAPFENEVEAVLAGYPRQDGYLLSLFRTFANSLRFLKKGVPNLLDHESPLDLRTREIIILRTTANNNCEYEWGVHVSIFSDHAELSPEQVRATRLKTPDCWTEKERDLLDVVDALCANGSLDDEHLVRFQSDWTVEAQLEIMALVGTYSTISYVANVARLPRESFGAEFPSG